MNLYYDLLKEWCDTLLTLQIREQSRSELYGGILCPACARVHGRCGDAIYPLMYLADVTGDEKYLDGARGLFAWTKNVSRRDGSLINDTNSDWKGITVFFAIQLGEALHHHGHLLDEETRREWQERFLTAAEYLLHHIDEIGGNINYPVTCAHAMAVAAQLTGDERYRKKAKALADQAMAAFTDDGLLYGEGKCWEEVTPKGCRPVDLGYNVEESLPALLSYAVIAEDCTVYDRVIEAMKIHLEFMLPDGAWDNSWGNRNNKWSYWGSRTSDGCQPGFGLPADEEPDFAEAVFRNTRLLKACTHNGLLYGGPMFLSAGEPPCVHHTFCHAKGLAALLGQRHGMLPAGGGSLPRERQEGVRFFPSLQVNLLARGDFRATLSDYDLEYSEEGHSTGGALTLLWHRLTGPVFTGTMNRYYLVEPNNMQIPRYVDPVCLTPRIETEEDGRTFMSCNDKQAEVCCSDRDGVIEAEALGQLRDGRQNAGTGPGHYRLGYRLDEESFCLTADTDSRTAMLYLPVICSSDETYDCSDYCLTVYKKDAVLTLKCSSRLEIEGDPGRRAFHPVGGMEAVLCRIMMVPDQEVTVTISVSAGSF